MLKIEVQIYDGGSYKQCNDRINCCLFVANGRIPINELRNSRYIKNHYNDQTFFAPFCIKKARYEPALSIILYKQTLTQQNARFTPDTNNKVSCSASFLQAMSFFSVEIKGQFYWTTLEAKKHRHIEWIPGGIRKLLSSLETNL